MKRALNLPPSTLGIFSQPERSRVLWHDAKVFPSAANIYLENMLSGIYGPLPSKIKKALFELKAANVFHLIVLENNSVLQKIEGGVLKAKPEKTLIQPFLKSALNFIEPVIRQHKVKIKTSFAKSPSIMLDKRYGGTFIQNLLLLAILGAQEGDEISVESFSNGFKITRGTQESAKSLASKFSDHQIYNMQATEASLPALMYFISQHLAHLFGGNFYLKVHQKKLTLLYEGC